MTPRAYLMLSASPTALHGCGIPGSNYAEFARAVARPPVIQKPSENDHAE